MAEKILPDAFADLAPLVAEWALPTEAERCHKRLKTDIGVLKAFHDRVFRGSRRSSATSTPSPTTPRPCRRMPKRLFDLALMDMEAAAPIDLESPPPTSATCFRSSASSSCRSRANSGTRHREAQRLAETRDAKRSSATPCSVRAAASAWSGASIASSVSWNVAKCMARLSARRKLADGAHRLVGVHVLGPHEPARLIGADRQQRDIRRPDPVAGSREMPGVAVSPAK